jgi:hypothetical protein
MLNMREGLKRKSFCLLLAKDCSEKPDGTASLCRHAQILNLIKPIVALRLNLIFTPRKIKHYGIQF